MNTINAMVKADHQAPGKCNINNNNSNHTNEQHHTPQKHSGPFYISPTLFDNRRLRLKRLRWAKVLPGVAGSKQPSQYPQPPQRKKTDRRKQNLSVLRADITIDLLSDEEEHFVAANRDCEQKLLPKVTQITTSEPPPLVPIQFQNNRQQQQTPPQPQLQPQQHFIVYPGHIELSKVPNITLIPVQNLTNAVAPPPIASVAPMPRCVKRKRKSQQPKRHAQVVVVNSESIVLSDDSECELSLPTLTPLTPPTPLPPPPAPAPALTVCARAKVITPTVSAAAAFHDPLPQTTITPVSVTRPKCAPRTTPPKPLTTFSTSTPTTLNTPISAQVDEEVTVSIVPRSSAAGSCSKPTINELFPMLPDETTVHTVIANRTYELSLTKLREGLATCGIPEFSNGQQKISPTRRKGQVIDTPPIAMPTPAPVSLKLSSDLSISLISDDEDDDHQHHQLAENLLRKQPQLSIQHLQMPPMVAVGAGAAMAAANNRQPPRRRKLG